MKRQDLIRAIDDLPDFPAPKPAFEQYRTPASVILEWMEEMDLDGCLSGTIVDLGCGVGPILYGLVASGAKHPLGIEIDLEVVELAREAMHRAGIEAEIIHGDAAKARELLGGRQVDHVVFNPPFGAQKANRQADRSFIDGAIELQPKTIWFLGRPQSGNFFQAYAKERGWNHEQVGQFQYALPRTMAHHQDAVRDIEVGLYKWSLA